MLVKRFEDAEAKEGGYARLTVSQLKAERLWSCRVSREVKCGALGLSKSGRKADLVARGHMKTLRMMAYRLAWKQRPPKRLHRHVSQGNERRCLAGRA